MNSLRYEFTGAFKKRNNAVAQIIIINVIAWLLYVTMLAIFRSMDADTPLNQMPPSLKFRLFLLPTPDLEYLLFRPWTVITYSFLHSYNDISHILSNMLFLYLFGRILNDYLGSDKVISVYILGAIAGVIAFIILFNLIPSYRLPYLVGASASVTAIAVAAATLAPNYTVNLLLFGPVRIIYIAAFLVVISYVRTLNGVNAGGNLAHLGGAIIGYAYIKALQKGTDLGKWVTSFRVWFMSLFKPKPKVKVSYRAKNKTKSTSKSKSKTTTKSSSSDVSQDEIDKILDKISQSGYESLTKEEKQKLFNASNK